MADFSNFLINTKIKIQEAIGDAASSIATNTKTKVSEFNLTARRNEILNGFGAKALEAWKNGVVFPDEFQKMLDEIGELNAQLDAINEERAAAIREKEAAAAKAREEAEAKKAAASKPKAPSLVVPEKVEESPSDNTIEDTEVTNTVTAIVEDAVEEVVAEASAVDAEEINYTADEDKTIQ